MKSKAILILIALIAAIAAGYAVGTASGSHFSASPEEGPAGGPGFAFDAEPSGTTTFNNISTGTLSASTVTATTLTAAVPTFNGTITLVNGETISNATDGRIHFSGTMHGYVNVLIKTANYNLSPGDRDSLSTNQGASGAVTFTLPGASAGYRYCFYVYEAQTLYVDTASGDQIHALTNAAGDRISNGTAGSAICLVAIDSTYWVPLATVGTWADAN